MARDTPRQGLACVSRGAKALNRDVHCVAWRVGTLNSKSGAMKRSWILVMACLLWPYLGGVARAEGNCPPGYYPTGGDQAGWHACAPMGPMEEEEPYSEEEAGYGGSSYGPSTQFDPEQWARWAQAAQDAEAAREELRMRDPAYRELRPGLWEFPNDRPPAPAICTAGFFTTRGGVLLMDWTGEHNGAFLAFWGGSIPRAERFEQQSVTLIQSGETQNVRAFHAPAPWAEDLGMILFAVPSTRALIDSIEDVQDFEVKLHGQTVIWGEWHSGRQAQAALRQCVERR